MNVNPLSCAAWMTVPETAVELEHLVSISAETIDKQSVLSYPFLTTSLLVLDFDTSACGNKF